MNNMPPTLGYNSRTNSMDFPEYDEQKFLVYSVFREKILDKIVKEKIREVALQTIESIKKRKEKSRLNKEIKSQERIKAREHSNQQDANEFDDGAQYPELPGFSVYSSQSYLIKNCLIGRTWKKSSKEAYARFNDAEENDKKEKEYHKNIWKRYVSRDVLRFTQYNWK